MSLELLVCAMSAFAARLPGGLSNLADDIRNKSNNNQKKNYKQICSEFYYEDFKLNNFHKNAK